MAEPMKVEQLESSEGETFRQLYAIYAASIAAREQKSEGSIAAMIGAADYRVWVAKAGGLVRAFSILFVPGAGRFALLEYMAVAPDQRNQGLGAELFRRHGHVRSEEHTSELQSHSDLVCRLLLEKKKTVSIDDYGFTSVSECTSMMTA